jgi:Zn-dependent protease with chaperone function
VKNIQKLISVLALGFSLFTFTPVLAQGTVSSSELLPDAIGANLGLARQDIRVTIARIIRVAMSLLGIIVVMIVLYGGFLWMTAGGNSEQVDKAKKFIISGIIGLAIVLSAYAVATFVINQLVSATTAGATWAP